MNKTRKETTEKVKQLIADKLYSHQEISNALGMNRQTLYTRRKLENWKAVEMNIINDL